MGTVDRLERIYRYEQSCEFLPHRLKSLALSLPDKQKERVEELRLRVMHPLTVLTLEGELNAAPDGRASLVTVEDLEQMLGAVTEYSRYACIETLRQGFLPLRGGFRLGVCGSAVVRDGEVSNLKDISSLALRIVCEHIGLGSDIAPQLFSADGRFLSTLILSPPGGGKTTLLRDLIRVLSLGDAEHRALRVAVIDERCELAVCCKGRAQMELGNHTDVLSLCPKAVGIPMVLRGMNPQVIAVDEITAEEDIRAMCLAANCGVGCSRASTPRALTSCTRSRSGGSFCARGCFAAASSSARTAVHVLTKWVTCHAPTDGQCTDPRRSAVAAKEFPFTYFTAAKDASRAFRCVSRTRERRPIDADAAARAAAALELRTGSRGLL